ncbi:Respiratory nitrate reductase alpha chain (plasmid) [Roseomonas mucosa]|uniref:nitrate reductase subunit alpha n=1 Tax=Roseomonas mucosa TaxID=207340 RepID=UPI0022087875|nr:nitrate reductase subunit alpha [Roseomonas mucosa]QDJ11604.1 Respiratory nitrate reductase alpha chain [Roseomonas mucosa]
MSQFVDRLLFFRKYKGTFSEGHGVVTDENRAWEDNYRSRWQSEKIVRSTHGVNCTGSCSWKIYVKNGLVTWETQQTDYPRTRPDLPNHEPRGCPRGASYSWYLYSSNRIKYPLVRGRLLAMWREARKTLPPVAAWKSIQDDAAKRHDYQRVRGLGGFVRADWDEVNELIAAANIHTVKQWGPDRVVGFSPIPAMSMISYAAGTRYLSLIGGTCLSFYDWYCDLPPSSPQTFGEQTDVPESADWYNSGYLLLWGSNVSLTRTPDAHFYTEARYRGAKSVVIAPDFIEVARFADLWLHPKQGTDAALALAMGHVILKEFFVDRQVPYFQDYVRKYSDLPFLVLLEKRDEGLVAGRMLRAADLPDALGQKNNPDWKPVVIDEATGAVVAPQGTAGFRWGEQGKWNLEPRDGGDGHEIRPLLSLLAEGDEAVTVSFPYFGNAGRFGLTDHAPVQHRRVPARTVSLKDGSQVQVATVFDLMLGNYGVDRGLGGGAATSFDDDVPGTPAWQERITGVPRDRCIAVARGFAANAEATNGRSMVILGAGLNHWYHMDMSYRAIMAMLTLCGCIGQSGGGWAHYVGQEKLRPQAGWLPIAFASDWVRPPRQMNGTSFFYAHTDQWRYERMELCEQISPLADPSRWSGTMIDCNVRAERMGWLPSSPQLARNPLQVARGAREAGKDPASYVAEGLNAGTLQMACEDPDAPQNWPRNLFVWRSNLLGASGKGHEYFLKHLLGARNNVLNEESDQRPEEVVRHDVAPEGKLDLLVTIDFRMNTTTLFSDVVLPTATWYEKADLNTSDMHPFIHPLQAAVDPVWGARTDWAIFREIAKAFQRLAPEELGVEEDVVLTPTLKDTPSELSQPYGGEDWRRGKSQGVPGRTMPAITVVPRDYAATYDRFISVGPLLEERGNGTKGMVWDTKEEVARLRHVNPPIDGDRPRLRDDLDAIEAVLSLAPETNGHVALKAWQALSKVTGRDHTHLIARRVDEKIEFRDIAAQPRPILTSPVWSGIESHEICYNAGWTNVHELIPWRTLTGRMQIYQDHPWMRDFGEGFVTYRPPIDTRSASEDLARLHDNGNTPLVLNFLTPHQKWGIHSTYTENLIMLTLARGGPIVWISERDAAVAGIEDNDWIEAFNRNGALVARAVVSQRIPQGAAFMYHAAERTANVPGSEVTQNRGGIHNSVTRVVLKPTHMIGGYAQLSYGFNYYGTVGSNRDEFIILRKMVKVDWRDRPLSEKRPIMKAEESTRLEGHRA